MQAVVVNAGIANACTGAEGFGYCEDTAKAAAELNIAEDAVSGIYRSDRYAASDSEVRIRH